MNNRGMGRRVTLITYMLSTFIALTARKHYLSSSSSIRSHRAYGPAAFLVQAATVGVLERMCTSRIRNILLWSLGKSALTVFL